jgi:hypothetical protein
VGTKDARRRGYIEARPNGTFRAVVFAGTDALPDRDRFIKRTAPTRREGEKLLAKLQNEVDDDGTRRPRSPSPRRWISGWKWP